MYIERDSRKTSPGKELPNGSEYLSRCLDLLIHHIVQELPRILGKWRCFLRPVAASPSAWLLAPPLHSQGSVPAGQCSNAYLNMWFNDLLNSPLLFW